MLYVIAEVSGATARFYVTKECVEFDETKWTRYFSPAISDAALFKNKQIVYNTIKKLNNRFSKLEFKAVSLGRTVTL